jgi:pimeloyl-ACP methyl ester carboxylesterase
LSGRLPPAEMFPAGRTGYSTHFVRVAPDLTIRVIEALGSGASHTPTLFIHGWGCSCFVWRRNLPAFAAAGIRTLALDLPGHGLSDKPLAAGRYSADALADSVIATLDRLGLPRVALVAHSLGAVVATRVATRANDRVSKLVLIAPVGLGSVPLIRLAQAITPRRLAGVVPYLTSRWLIATGLWLSRSGKTTLTERDIDEYWAPTQFPEMTIAAWRMLHDFDWKPHPRAVDARTLVIVAGGDRLVHVPTDATYHVVEGAGHNVQEQAPDEVNALVLSFLTA